MGETFRRIALATLGLVLTYSSIVAFSYNVLVSLGVGLCAAAVFAAVGLGTSRLVKTLVEFVGSFIR